jgi:mannose-6-phosphate isomerase-like protein (cupin superfamily)
VNARSVTDVLSSQAPSDEAKISDMGQTTSQLSILVRHEGETPSERSTCGWRHLLISRQDKDLDVAAWAHAVDIDGAREHYHKRSTELYYVLEGEGTVTLNGVEHPVRKGSIVHIPPGVVHGAKGRVRVLVVGVPDIADDDLFFPEPLAAGGGPAHGPSR